MRNAFATDMRAPTRWCEWVPMSVEGQWALVGRFLRPPPKSRPMTRNGRVKTFTTVLTTALIALVPRRAGLVIAVCLLRRDSDKLWSTRAGITETGGMLGCMSMRALVRRPGPLLAHGLVSHIERRVVDVDLAFRQWLGYVDALAGHGWDVIEATPADDCPDAVFVEDPVVVCRDLAVVARSGAVGRRREVGGVEAAVRAAGYRVERIVGPGTLDGGDVLKVGNTVYVGRSGRTNDDGIRQLAEHLAPFGVTVAAVPVTKVLHLKSAVTALPDGTVIGYPPLVDDPSVFPRFLAVPEEAGAHVVLLGEDRVLMSSSATATAELFAGSGLEPVLVEVGEFEKLEGCVTCLSVRLR